MFLFLPSSPSNFSVITLSLHPAAIQMVPTGLSGVPPVGPAIPEVATAHEKLEIRINV